MGIISVIVRTHDGVETWGVWDDVDEARHYAIDASINGHNVEWVKVVEALDGDPATGRNAVLGHYERGVSVDPDSGLPDTIDAAARYRDR